MSGGCLHSVMLLRAMGDVYLMLCLELPWVSSWVPDPCWSWADAIRAWQIARCNWKRMRSVKSTMGCTL